MRLWTLHPRYLDRQGLLANWREGLLAKSVLERWTVDPEASVAYRNHPQLDRFKNTDHPCMAIAIYLAEILAESRRRNYRFDDRKIDVPDVKIVIPVTAGQIEYERQHLLKKLIKRDPQAARQLSLVQELLVHPMFVVMPGGIESWEKQR
ncbi:MAG: pyrimidine dimer DNA glycosylase/endonuclease V [Thermoguttaceae bacterium]|nr:pyrimidine dimer DNA glycosylase/endonuclease V [Thermoguttaceae bacterium]